MYASTETKKPGWGKCWGERKKSVWIWQRGRKYSTVGGSGERFVQSVLTFIFHTPFEFYNDLFSSELVKERLGVDRHRLQSDENFKINVNYQSRYRKTQNQACLSLKK